MSLVQGMAAAASKSDEHDASDHQQHSRCVHVCVRACIPMYIRVLANSPCPLCHFNALECTKAAVCVYVTLCLIEAWPKELVQDCNSWAALTAADNSCVQTQACLLTHCTYIPMAVKSKARTFSRNLINTCNARYLYMTSNGVMQSDRA